MNTRRAVGPGGAPGAALAGPRPSVTGFLRGVASAGLAWAVLAGPSWRYGYAKIPLGIDAGAAPLSRAILLVTGVALVAAAFRRQILSRGAEADLCLLGLVLAGALAVPWALSNSSPVGQECLMLMAVSGGGLLAGRVCHEPVLIVRSVAFAGAARATCDVLLYARGDGLLVPAAYVRAGGPLPYADPVVVMSLVGSVWLASTAGRTSSMAFWSTASALLFAAILLSWGPAGMLGAMAGLGLVGWRLMRLPAVSRLLLVPGAFVCLIAVPQASPSSESIVESGPVQASAVPMLDRIAAFERYWLIARGQGCASSRDAAGLPGWTAIPNRTSPIRDRGIPLLWLDELGVGGGALLALVAMAIARSLKAGVDPAAPVLAASWLSAGAVTLLGGVLPGPGDPGAAVSLGALGAATLLLERGGPQLGCSGQRGAGEFESSGSGGDLRPVGASGLLMAAPGDG